MLAAFQILERNHQNKKKTSHFNVRLNLKKSKLPFQNKRIARSVYSTRTATDNFAPFTRLTFPCQWFLSYEFLHVYVSFTHFPTKLYTNFLKLRKTIASTILPQCISVIPYGRIVIVMTLSSTKSQVWK